MGLGQVFLQLVNVTTQSFQLEKVSPSASSEQVDRLTGATADCLPFKSYWSCTNIVAKNLLTFGNSQGGTGGKGLWLLLENRKPQRRMPSAGGLVNIKNSCQESREAESWRDLRRGGDRETSRSRKWTKVVYFTGTTLHCCPHRPADL